MRVEKIEFDLGPQKDAFGMFIVGHEHEVVTFCRQMNAALALVDFMELDYALLAKLDGDDRWIVSSKWDIKRMFG